MQEYVKIYLDYFDLGEQSLITCEGCLKQGRVDGSGFDIHHIDGRGPDKDVIENLMCLCRKHHDQTNSNKLPKDELKYIHSYFLLGHRKKFLNA